MLDEFTDELIISYGDIVYSRHTHKLIHSNSDISVVVDMDWQQYWSQRSDDPLSDAETLRLSQDGRILEIGKA